MLTSVPPIQQAHIARTSPLVVCAFLLFSIQHLKNAHSSQNRNCGITSQADIKNVKENRTMNVKELFEKAENGALTYDQFVQAAKDAKAKFVDLSEGAYVSRSKYDDDMQTKDAQINTLNGTISTRDADLANIKKQLEEAGVDAQKLSTLSTDLSTLQGKYDTDIKNYQERLTKQAYEFAVKEFANTQKFTSNAAKRDFISSLINENFKMNDKSEIIGANDFVKMYAESNADAFVVESTPEPTPTKPQPTFVQPTNQTTPPSKPTLTDLMMAKNNNPSMEINF
jgi:hypothetical protein